MVGPGAPPTSRANESSGRERPHRGGAGHQRQQLPVVVRVRLRPVERLDLPAELEVPERPADRVGVAEPRAPVGLAVGPEVGADQRPQRRAFAEVQLGPHVEQLVVAPAEGRGGGVLGRRGTRLQRIVRLPGAPGPGAARLRGPRPSWSRTFLWRTWRSCPPGLLHNLQSGGPPRRGSRCWRTARRGRPGRPAPQQRALLVHAEVAPEGVLGGDAPGEPVAGLVMHPGAEAQARRSPAAAATRCGGLELGVVRHAEIDGPGSGYRYCAPSATCHVSLNSRFFVTLVGLADRRGRTPPARISTTAASRRCRAPPTCRSLPRETLPITCCGTLMPTAMLASSSPRDLSSA